MGMEGLDSTHVMMSHLANRLLQLWSNSHAIFYQIRAKLIATCKTSPCVLITNAARAIALISLVPSSP